MNIRVRSSSYVSLAAVALGALPFFVNVARAQTTTTPAPSTLPSAITAGAPVAYRSAMEGYKSYTDEKTIDWKEANDSTGRIGGWREYAKEAQQPEVPAAAAKPAPQTVPVKP